MSNYTPVTNFLSKDSLVSGNPLKALKGAELSTEFAAVATAVNSKPDGSTSYFPDGSATQPSVGFTNNAGTGMYNVAGALDFATGATLRLSIAASGAITAATLVTANAGLAVSGVASTFAAPASGNTLTISALANANAIVINSSTTSGQSFGVAINAGTTSADSGLRVFNASGTLQWSFLGDGSLVSNGAGASQGTGTINCSGLFIGTAPVYVGIPQNAQSGAYTTVLADANKHIANLGAGSAAWTIAANSSVAYPVGTTIVFVNGSGGAASTIAINSDTLVWANGTAGGGTGTRTLTHPGVATAIKITATVWVISGTGLT